MFSFFKKQNKENDAESRLLFAKKLQALTNKIHSTGNIDEIMLDLSKDICDLFDCDRMTLYAVGQEKDCIYAKVKTGIDGNTNLVLPINAKSIAGYVAATKQSVRLRDAYDAAELKTHAPELEFYHAVDQITGYHTRQMLAAPIVGARGRELLGVIQLLNNRSSGEFSESAEVGLEELCETIAVAYAQRMKPAAAAPKHGKYNCLVADGLISAPEMELAVRAAERKKLDLEEVLVNEFQLDLAAIGASLSKAFNIPYERFKPDRDKPADVLNKLKRDLVERGQCLPIDDARRILTVITTEPEHIGGARELRNLFPYHSTLTFRVTTKQEFRQTVDQFFGPARGPA
ncbi:MAG TPA: GAF domain-containing protein [Paucimonas sp.]|nr:GAF domain-containing protein [Paucimonas sp.]